jgi:hypothetical protein
MISLVYVGLLQPSAWLKPAQALGDHTLTNNKNRERHPATLERISNFVNVPAFAVSSQITGG